MTKSPYVPVLGSEVMPAQALASSPQMVPKREAMLSASVVAGTQAEEATMVSQAVALGVGGRRSEASQRVESTAGQARGVLEGV